MYCKDCKYWKRHDGEYINVKRGRCSNDKFIDASGFDHFDEEENELLGGDDTLEYSDFESYKAEFDTGEKFGCIHFEAGDK